MQYIAEIDIMPHKELLDPQGKAVMKGLDNLGIENIDQVRIGKHVTLTVEADSEEAAKEKVDTACRKLLANLIMEKYTFELTPLN
jgi:phosphoribosylformylglycinamidine synthase